MSKKSRRKAPKGNKLPARTTDQASSSIDPTNTADVPPSPLPAKPESCDLEAADALLTLQGQHAEGNPSFVPEQVLGDTFIGQTDLEKAEEGQVGGSVGDSRNMTSAGKVVGVTKTSKGKEKRKAIGKSLSTAASQKPSSTLTPLLDISARAPDPRPASNRHATATAPQTTLLTPSPGINPYPAPSKPTRPSNGPKKTFNRDIHTLIQAEMTRRLSNRNVAAGTQSKEVLTDAMRVETREFMRLVEGLSRRMDEEVRRRREGVSGGSVVEREARVGVGGDAGMVVEDEGRDGEEGSAAFSGWCRRIAGAYGVI